MDLIRVEQKEKQEFVIKIRDHEIISDMVVADGGQDHGPRAVELLVGSLGACIGKTIAHYCENIGCDSKGIGVYLTYELTDKPKQISNIVADIELPKDFPENRKRAIKKIIHMCPVHNTLMHAPKIDMEIIS